MYMLSMFIAEATTHKQKSIELPVTMTLLPCNSRFTKVLFSTPSVFQIQFLQNLLIL